MGIPVSFWRRKLWIRHKLYKTSQNMLKKKMTGEGSGHDWWHIVRVRNMAERIAEAEGGNLFICQIAALVHDLADDKLVDDEKQALEDIRQLLAHQGCSESDIEAIMDIIQNMSFKGGKAHQRPLSLEGKIVQDADRLDAIGAIGIARTMAYSGNKNRVIHNPNLKVREDMTVEEYRSTNGSAITHFYEKLLKLKDLMNTETGKKLARGRHDFLELYLQQFYQEWDGKR
ncbi:HD domain-containing protein [Streptococcus suis]|nr:HD domain-containing protein [Streptococcus suis]